MIARDRIRFVTDAIFAAFPRVQFGAVAAFRGRRIVGDFGRGLIGNPSLTP